MFWPGLNAHMRIMKYTEYRSIDPLQLHSRFFNKWVLLNTFLHLCFTDIEPMKCIKKRFWHCIKPANSQHAFSLSGFNILINDWHTVTPTTNYNILILIVYPAVLLPEGLGHKLDWQVGFDEARGRCHLICQLCSYDDHRQNNAHFKIYKDRKRLLWHTVVSVGYSVHWIQYMGSHLFWVKYSWNTELGVTRLLWHSYCNNITFVSNE